MQYSTILTLWLRALAAPPSPEALQITVDTQLGGIDAAVKERVTAGLSEVSAALGHPIHQEAPKRVHVELSWHEDTTTDFLVVLEAHGEPAGETGSARVEFVCPECSPPQLLDRIVDQATPLIGDLFASVPPPVAPAEPPAPDEAAPPQPAPARLTTLAKAGIGTLAGGIVLAGTGTTFLLVGERRPADDPTKLRDFRPAGYTLVGVGAAAAVAGAVLLILDHTRSNRRNTARLWNALQGRF